MFQQPSSKQLRLQRLITTVLLAWLGGLNCLLCCGPNVLAAVPEAESCAAAGQSSAKLLVCAEDDCCAEPGAQEESSAPCEEECCILDAPAAQPQALQFRQLTVTPAAAGWLLMALATNPPVNIARLRPPLLVGQQTHLRCCVFLI